MCGIFFFYNSFDSFWFFFFFVFSLIVIAFNYHNVESNRVSRIFLLFTQKLMIMILFEQLSAYKVWCAKVICMNRRRCHWLLQPRYFFRLSTHRYRFRILYYFRFVFSYKNRYVWLIVMDVACILYSSTVRLDSRVCWCNTNADSAITDKVSQFPSSVFSPSLISLTCTTTRTGYRLIHSSDSNQFNKIIQWW